jgi:ribosomal protein S18 acetylase RimI-like enzyme
MKIKYRKATGRDFEVTFQIKVHSIKPYIEKIWGWEDKAQLEYHIKDFEQNHIQIILDDDSNELGLLTITEDSRSINLKSILIHSDVQRTGIGTKIIKDIIQRARSTNKSIELQVFKINGRAKNLYERLGFVVTGQTEFHYQMIYK